MTVTVITGTSSGIGLATAVRLSKAGHKVYAGARNPAGAENLKAAIEQANGAISMLEMDVVDEQSINKAIGLVIEAEGQIDVLVNNAGIARGSSVEETSMAAIRELFETNFFGLVAVTKAVLPGMRQWRSGTIVNISSIAGRLVTPSNAFYVASKFAVEALSESLAAQLGPFNVRVAIIEPGVIATSIFANSQKAQDPPDMNSPYIMHGRRVMAMFTKALMHETPTPADAVAQVIEHAIITDDPKLRYLAGDDAKEFWAARQKITDEDALKFSTIEDDDEYYDKMADLMGKDYFRS